MSRGTFQLQNCTALRCFWGKKGRDCGEEGARNRNSPKILPYIHWHFQKLATDSTAWRSSTGGAGAEKQQGHTEIWILGLCMSGTLGGVQGTAVPCPACLWAARGAGENGAAAPQESTGRAGSCLRRCREPIMDLRLQAARPQHLPQRPRGSCAHSRLQHHLQRRGRGQHSSAAQGRWGRGCRSCFPPAAFPGGHPKSSGQPRAGGEAQPASASTASFFFIHRTPLLAWGATVSPSMTSLDSVLLSSAFLTWQAKHLWDLFPFKKHDKQRRYARQFS